MKPPVASRPRYCVASKPLLGKGGLWFSPPAKSSAKPGQTVGLGRPLPRFYGVDETAPGQIRPNGPPTVEIEAPLGPSCDRSATGIGGLPGAGEVERRELEENEIAPTWDTGRPFRRLCQPSSVPTRQWIIVAKSNARFSTCSNGRIDR